MTACSHTTVNHLFGIVTAFEVAVLGLVGVAVAAFIVWALFVGK